MLHTAHVEPLALGNLDPRVNAQFEDAVTRIVEHMNDESEKFGTGTRTASIEVKVSFECDLERRSTTMSVSLSSKLPKYRTSVNTLRNPRGGERFLIEIEDADQIDLFHQDQDDDAPEGSH